MPEERCRIFYDNVAPLAIRADVVYLGMPLRGQRLPKIKKLQCPENLHMTTITPDYAVSTAEATKMLRGKTVDILEAENAGGRYAEVMLALSTGDLNLLIRSCGNNLVEPIRAAKVPGLETLKK
jgi:homoserine kinase